VGLLLEMGFPVGVVPHMAENITALYFACRYAHKNQDTASEIVQLILAKNSTLKFINAETYGGKTALLMAYASGNRAVIELLLQHGAILGPGLTFTSSFVNGVDPMPIIRQAVSDPDSLKAIPLDLLKRYTQKHSKRKIAARLLNILTGVAGVSPLTWEEKAYLNIASFFNTELGFIYNLSLNFRPPEKKISETVPLLAADNSERRDDTESVVLESTPQAQSTKTVMGQVGWVAEVAGPPRVVEEEKTHEKQVGGVSGELESVEPVKPFEDNAAYFDRRTPPPSPQPAHHEDIKNNNNAVEGSNKSLKK